MTKSIPLALAVLFLSILPPQARAQAPAPGPGIPLPPERPAEVAPAAPVSEPGPSGPLASPPVPPGRPDRLDQGVAAAPVPIVAVADDTACRRRLDRLGVKWGALPPLAEGVCGAERPLKLVTAADGLALSAAVTTVCPVAEALARWSTEVQVAAEKEFGHLPTALRIGGSYECRGQNHDPDAKLSDHARAGAVDVMGFEFQGRAPLAVSAQPVGTPEARFQETVRAAACGMFRTVLGPGADPQHANHFHLDLRDRPKGYRICE